MGQVRYPVLELRQYTLLPGQRDVLIDIFDREFVETQEAEGMAILGQFRDLDRPDRFVWLRGYTDIASENRLAGYLDWLTRQDGLLDALPGVRQQLRLAPTARSLLR
jgi:hypothetical protein